MEGVSGIISIALAALAGGLGVLAVREALRLAPGAARWLAVAVEPLRRAGSEGHVPSRSERRRLGLLAAAVLLAIGLWFLGPAPAAPLAAAGPAAAGMLVARRAARYRAAVESGLLAGVQFHPERSGAAGARVLENAIRWSRSA